MAWACQIAYWEVRRSRQKFARSKVVFNQVLADAISETAVELMPEMSARHDALMKCLEKLHPRDRELLLTRYEPGNGVEEAAERSGRSLVKVTATSPITPCGRPTRPTSKRSSGSADTA